MAAAVLTPVDLQVTKTVLAQAVSDDPASVASRADIGLRLNGRTQRRASSCQTRHAPESTASPLLAPRVSPSLAPIRPAVDHTSFAGIWAWLSRQTTPRIPRNMGRSCSELNHGFRQKIPGVSLAELPMGFAGLCWVWAALSYI